MKYILLVCLGLSPLTTRDFNEDMEVPDRNIVEKDIMKSHNNTRETLMIHEVPSDWTGPPPDK